MLIFNILKRHWVLFTIIVIVSVFAGFMEGIKVALIFPILQGVSGTAMANMPYIIGEVVSFFEGMDIGMRVRVVALLLLFFTVLQGGLIYLSIVMAMKLRIKAIREVRGKCIDQIFKVSMSFYNDNSAAFFQRIFTYHCEQGIGSTVGLIGDMISRLFMVAILVCILLMVSWKLTLISILLVGVSSMVIKLTSVKLFELSKKTNVERHGFNRIIFEVFHGMKLIRQFNRESDVTRKYKDSVDRVNNALYKYFKLSQAANPLFETLGMVVLCVILVVGSFIIPKDETVWLGILFAFIVTLSRLINPVKALNRILVQIMGYFPVLKELDAFLSNKNKTYIENGNKKFSKLEEELEFENVVFKYQSNKQDVLKGISLNIPRGKQVGIVGPSGSGKSTITELIMRFYDPQEGKILIDGKDLREYDCMTLRKKIGTVSQDNFLFNDTIRNNIIFAFPDSSEEDMIKAAKKAHIHDFICSLPDGYDSVIGERGVLLSGGERQRVAIARAILPEPEILIFDEATSSLDTRSERLVQEALDDVSRGKTVVTIAHRLSTVRNADVIFVLDDGRIVEKGSHEELIGNSGLYWKLMEAQGGFATV